MASMASESTEPIIETPTETPIAALAEKEEGLHHRVIEFIRRFFPEAIIIAGLGELQRTPGLRINCWRKGYTKGQADIILLNRTACFSGLAIELKSPTGLRPAFDKLSLAQRKFLDNVRSQLFDTLVSNCYEEVIVRIIEHRDACRSLCSICIKIDPLPEPRINSAQEGGASSSSSSS